LLYRLVISKKKTNNLPRFDVQLKEKKVLFGFLKIIKINHQLGIVILVGTPLMTVYTHPRGNSPNQIEARQ